MTITSLICLPGLIILPLVAQNAGTINPPAPKKIISYGSGDWKDGHVRETRS